ncbi:MAG: hypothetical protein R2761_07045 [Acidimicrobiales bacterium]
MTPPNVYLASLLVEARQRDLGELGVKAPWGRRRRSGRTPADAQRGGGGDVARSSPSSSGRWLAPSFSCR